MNAAKPCPQRYESLVALVMGQLDDEAARELEAHLTACEACRAARDALAEEERQIRLRFEVLARRLAPLERTVLEEVCGSAGVRGGTFNHHLFERVKSMILAHKQLSAAVAAAVALAASLVVYVTLFSYPDSAYALEQTAEANEGVTRYHYKVTPAPANGGVSECWIELNPDGTLRRARTETFSPYDGPKVAILSKDRGEVWFKIKHVRAIVGNADRDVLQHAIKELERARAALDPKLAFEQLQAAEKAGKVQIETHEPTSLGECITLMVTRKNGPDRFEVYEVDPETKLVQQIITWQGKGKRRRVVQVQEYLDYNQPFDPSVFQLKLPKHVVTMDRTRPDFGLEQGSLTDDEIAMKVAREFFEALLAGDYQKASRCYGGVPVDVLQSGFSNTRFLRLIEVGKPIRDKHPDKNALKVPVKIEQEVDGHKEVKEFRPYVRRESGRWTICGGI